MKHVLMIILAFALSTAHADGRAMKPHLSRVRDHQTKAELVYRASGVMTASTMDRTMAVVDEGITLLREISSDPALSEDERGRLYDEVLRGEGDNRQRGSLEKIFWSTVTHHGADDVDRFTGDVDGFKVFRQTFYEVFLDLKALVTFREDGDGQRIWTPRDRINRERTSRALAVRFADALHMMDKVETRSEEVHNFGYETIKDMNDLGVELRRERVVAERLAAISYAAMVVANLFAPTVLPFVHFNWVGLVTGGAWGSAPFSGLSYISVYLGATVAKLLGSTNKTYRMLKDIERMTSDPGKDELKQAAHRAFRKKLLEGKTTLGRHRQKMMARGYQPDNLTAMTCAQRLDSAFL